MDIMVSRLVSCLNGAMYNDANYKIAKFIIEHYLDIENMSEEDFLAAGPFQKLDLDRFVGSFGFENYEAFKLQFYQHYQIRLNQIRVRLFDADPEVFMKKMEKVMTDDEMNALVTDICRHFYEAKRIVIMGAYYPKSICVELQSDMITFGRPCIQSKDIDPLTFCKDDVVIIISATGRALRNVRKKFKDMHIDQAYSILFTQNKSFRKLHDEENTEVVVLPGKFDSVEFNYQLMSICDLLRLKYFKQYYLM